MVGFKLKVMKHCVLVLIILFVVACTRQKADVVSASPKLESAIVPMRMEEYNAIIGKKYNHPLINQALKDTESFYRAQNKDIKELSLIIKKAAKGCHIVINEKFLDRVRVNLTKEDQYISQFDTTVSQMQSYDLQGDAVRYDPHVVTYPVRFNKMSLFVEYSLGLSNEDLKSFITGEVMKNNEMQSKFPTPDVLDGVGQNPRSGLMMPSIITTMLVALRTIDVNAYEAYVKTHLKNSAIFNWYSTPLGLVMDDNSAFNVLNNKVDGMLIVHNGYAFGGHVVTAKSSAGRSFLLPYDCAMYINRLLGFNKDLVSNEYQTLWTGDFYNFYNFLTNSENFVFYDDIQKKLSSYGELARKLNAVKLNGIEDVKDGDILFFRQFSKDKNINNSLGSGGHIGIVLGTDGKDKIYIFSYLRNYETKATGGALISAVSLKNISNNISSTAGLLRYRQKLDAKQNTIDVRVSDSDCVLSYGDKKYKCVIGKGGLSTKKREGDGATPVGTFDLRQVFYRYDRLQVAPVTRLDTVKIEKNYGWCDDKKGSKYNQFVLLPVDGKKCGGYEELYMQDSLYDVMTVIGYNDINTRPDKGSAIFLHVARDGYVGTDGCVAMSKGDLLELLSMVNKQTKINIH